MSSPLSSLGLTALLETAMLQVDAFLPELTPEAREQVQEALMRFLQNPSTFSDCQSVLHSTISRDTPLTRLHEILSVSDDPLPSAPNSPITDASLALRRRTRPWTNVEDDRLLAAIGRYGLDNWQQVAHFVGSGRNRAQCSQRWARGLNPRISKKAWSPEEERQLQALVKQYGKKSWAKIASIIGNRSDVQCRYHYRQTVAAEAHESDHQLTLMRKSRLTASTNLFEGMTKKLPPPPAIREREQQITLRQSRDCISTPMIAAGKAQSERQRLLPLSPIRERNAPQQTGAYASLSPTRVKWEAFGSDPDSLNSFLKHFQ
jgi:hypothetical protein